MMIGDAVPNLYDHDAFKKGYEAFKKKRSISQNPYPAGSDLSAADWRIGWVTASLDKQIRRNDGRDRKRKGES